MERKRKQAFLTGGQIMSYLNQYYFKDYNGVPLNKGDVVESVRWFSIEKYLQGVGYACTHISKGDRFIVVSMEGEMIKTDKGIDLYGSEVKKILQ